MKTICSYCKVVIKEGKLINGKVSHGCCPACLKRVIKELEEK